jgi:hypothetical protein
MTNTTTLPAKLAGLPAVLNTLADTGQYHRRPVSPPGPLVPGIVVYARRAGSPRLTETR